MATSLRLPPDLEADLKQLAIEHERSVHGEMLYALKSYVKQQKRSAYTVAYQVGMDGKVSEGEMSIEAESKDRALEFAQAELENRFPDDAVLLECKVVL